MPGERKISNEDVKKFRQTFEESPCPIWKSTIREKTEVAEKSSSLHPLRAIRDFLSKGISSSRIQTELEEMEGPERNKNWSHPNKNKQTYVNGELQSLGGVWGEIQDIDHAFKMHSLSCKVLH